MVGVFPFVNKQDVSKKEVFMHIGQIHSGMYWGGGEEQVFRLHRGLPDINIHSVLFASPQSDLAAEATDGWSVVDKAAALQKLPGRQR